MLLFLVHLPPHGKSRIGSTFRASISEVAAMQLLVFCMHNMGSTKCDTSKIVHWKVVSYIAGSIRYKNMS